MVGQPERKFLVTNSILLSWLFTINHHQLEARFFTNTQSRVVTVVCDGVIVVQVNVFFLQKAKERNCDSDLVVVTILT